MGEGTRLLAASSVALGIGLLAMPGIASAADSNSYQAQLAGAERLRRLRHVHDLAQRRRRRPITEHVTGLADTFSGKPYPHVQHIHIGAKGECPTIAG